MQKGHPSWDSLVGIEGDHTLQKVHANLVQVLSMFIERDAFPFGEGGLEVR